MLKQSANRQSTIEFRDRQLATAADNAKVDQKIFNQKLQEQNEAKEREIENLNNNLAKAKSDNKQLTVTCERAEKGATVHTFKETSKYKQYQFCCCPNF